MALPIRFLGLFLLPPEQSKAYIVEHEEAKAVCMRPGPTGLGVLILAIADERVMVWRRCSTVQATHSMVSRTLPYLSQI